MEQKKQFKIEPIDILLIIVLTILAFSTRYYNIGFPKNYYFDEIHYIPATQAYLNHNEQDPNTMHPPLAKIIMSVGQRFFGDNPIGWRIMGVIFGAGMIPIIYLFAGGLFNSRYAAVFAACLLH